MESPDKSTSKRSLPLWLFMALPLLASAASHDFWAPDEPRYGQVAREIFSGGGRLAMHLNGGLYPDKPPLLFWTAGLLGWLTGWSELAMRLVSIVATLITAQLVGVLAKRWWRSREAAWAPAFFLGTVMVTEIGGRLQIDPLLAMLTTLAIVLVDGAPSKRNVRLAGLALGLGVLAKGPIAILIPVLVAIAWRFTPGAKRPGELFRLRSILFDPIAIALALVPAGLWAAAAIRSEPSLMGPLLFGQHLGRITEGGGGNHWAPPWQHLWSLPLLVFPWTLPFLASLVSGLRASRARGRSAERDLGLARAFAWFAVLFLFFSIIPPKRNLYLLPAYPAIALLCARWWSTVLPDKVAGLRERALGRLARIGAPCFLLLFGLLLVGLGCFVSFGLLSDDLSQRLAELPRLRESAYWRLGLGGLVFAGGGVLGLRALGTRPATPSKTTGIAWEIERTSALRLGQSGAGTAALVSWSLGASLVFVLLMPLGDQVKSARGLALQIKELHEQYAASSIPCMGIKPEGLRFYGDVPTVVVWDFDGAEIPEDLLAVGRVREVDLDWLKLWEEHEGGDFLAVVGEAHWKRFTPDQRASFKVLLEGRLGSKKLVVVGSKGE